MGFFCLRTTESSEGLQSRWNLQKHHWTLKADFLFGFIFVWITADELLSMKASPALINNSLILLCPRNQLFILIGCFSSALPNDTYSPGRWLTVAFSTCHIRWWSLGLFLSFLLMILISFHPPQSYLFESDISATMSLHSIPPATALPLSLHYPSGMPAFMRF